LTDVSDKITRKAKYIESKIASLETILLKGRGHFRRAPGTNEIANGSSTAGMAG